MPDDETPDPSGGRGEEPAQTKGSGTLILRAQDAADKRAEKRRMEERERDKEQEAGKDVWAQKALDAMEQRALAAEAGGVTKDELNGSLHKRYGAIIFFLVAVVAGLAGKTISGNFLKGEINISGSAVPTESE